MTYCMITIWLPLEVPVNVAVKLTGANPELIEVIFSSQMILRKNLQWGSVRKGMPPRAGTQASHHGLIQSVIICGASLLPRIQMYLLNLSYLLIIASSSADVLLSYQRRYICDIIDTGETTLCAQSISRWSQAPGHLFDSFSNPTLPGSLQGIRCFAG